MSAKTQHSKPSKPKSNDDYDDDLPPPGLKEVLLKKVLPYLALALIPICSSLNTVTTRAAYIYVPEGKQTLRPFVLAFARLQLAFFCFFVAKWVRNNILISSPVVNNSSSTDQKETNNKNECKMHTLSEAVTTKTENDEMNKSSTIVEIASSLSIEDQKREKEGTLRDPIHFSPALMDVVKSWGLGALTCVNVFVFVWGIQLTDGITTGAFLSTMPAVVFIIGYFMNLEVYSHMRMLATMLILTGNVVMNHLWRLFLGTTHEANDPRKRDGSYYLGVAFLAIAIICGSFYFVYQKVLSSRMSMLDFLTHMYGFAAFLALALSLFPRENVVSDQILSGLYPMAWAAIFVGGFVQCFVGFFLFSYATEFIGSSLIVTLFRAASPVLIVMESVWFLGEELDEYQVYGGIVVISGIVCTILPLVFASSAKPHQQTKEEKSDKKEKDESSNNKEEEEEATAEENTNDEETNHNNSRSEGAVVMSPTTVYASRS